MALDRIRTRFAPSPTGYMHVGNLRTALYAFLTARRNNGDFLLRIEDTDQSRQVEGAVEIIYNTLTETKLFWDEGPDIGGPYGPYVQSERKSIYKEYAEMLYDQAVVAEGGELRDPVKFAKRTASLMAAAIEKELSAD